MSSLQIQQVLAEMRALQSRVGGVGDPFGGVPGVASTAGAQATGAPAIDFASLLKGTIDNVATMQNQATSMAESYEAGDKSADITKVMLEVQKAGLAFRAMTEVRNKLVDAYTQVMQMSV
jgi:flagellar hook-basal body complex protein FliE